MPQAVFDLGQNRPNPFNPMTEICFTIAETQRTNLRIYDLSGRLVRSLVDGALPAGDHRVVWNGLDDNGRAAPSGVYLYRLEADDFRQSRSMTLLR
jgi:flagellar hook assembly protein FlgD